MSTLRTPVDIASLVAFRIGFAAVMLVAVGRYFAYDWIDSLYLQPTFFFTYQIGRAHV